MASPRTPIIRALGTTLALLASMLLLAPAAAPQSAPDAAQAKVLRQRYDRLRSKVGQQRRELRETKKSQQRITDQLNESYQRLEDAEQALEAVRTKLNRVRARLDRVTRQLAEAEARYESQQQRVGARVAADYREGPITFVDVLFRAHTVGDFLDREYYVGRILERDAQLLSELRETKEQIKLQRAELQVLHAQVSETVQDEEGKVAMVKAQAYEREQLLHSIRSERALEEQRLAELEQDSLDIQRSLQAEWSRRGGGANLPAWTGRWAVPTAGRITSGYGYRTHPILKTRRLHTGIDIGAPKGTAVHAAASGEVFHASWRGGYGRCIIILHGNDYSTLYGHLSTVAVSRGQRVEKGAVIGRVGSTGLSTGPHLHFEVRQHGVPVNPG